MAFLDQRVHRLDDERRSDPGAADRIEQA